MVKCNKKSICSCYAKSGFSPIPLQPNSKKCKHGVKDEDLRGRWLKFLTPDKVQNIEEELPLFFDFQDNIALLTGPETGQTVIDEDIIEKFEVFYSREKLLECCNFVVKTPSGKLHYHFEYDPDLEDASYIEEAGFELFNKRRIIVPPSKLENGQYTFIKCGVLTKMPPDLKTKILFLQATKKSSMAKKDNDQITYSVNLEKLKEKLLEHWVTGQRQFLAMYSAGLLRKAGLSEDLSRILCLIIKPQIKYLIHFI